MPRRFLLAALLLTLLLAAVAVLVIRLVGGASSQLATEVTPDKLSRPAIAEAPAPESVADLATKPSRLKSQDPFLGLPEDYGLEPSDFHRIRLRTQQLGRPEPGQGVVTLPGFRYVTLNRRVGLDYKELMDAGRALYEAVLSQRILTDAPFTIIIHNLDPGRFESTNTDLYAEPALPVLPDVESVQPPLVLREQPTSEVRVIPDQPLSGSSEKLLETLRKEERYAGDLLIRSLKRIPLSDVKANIIPGDFMIVLR